MVVVPQPEKSSVLHACKVPLHAASEAFGSTASKADALLERSHGFELVNPHSS